MLKEKKIEFIKSNPCIVPLILPMVKSNNNTLKRLTESDCHDIVCFVLDHFSVPTLIHFLNELPDYKDLTSESYDFNNDKYLELIHFELYDDIQSKLYEILDSKNLNIFDDTDNTVVTRYYNYINFDKFGPSDVCPNR